MKMNQKTTELCRTAIARSHDFIDTNRLAVDSIEDLRAHYKGVYMNAVCSDRASARRYADMIVGRYLQDDGDFRTRPDWKGWKNLECAPANRYIYSNGWIVCGLERMGAHAAARKGVDFISRFQSSRSGGFFSRFDVAAGQVVEGEMNSGSTASAGLAMIACGRVADAVRGGDFLLRLIKEQPDPERYVFVTYHDDRGVLTDVFGCEDVAEINARQHFCVDLKNDPRKELMWQLGKPMKLLAALYGLTGEKRFLNGAMWLVDRFDAMSEEKWGNLGSCKVMWGTAELFLHTADERFFGIAERLVKWICEVQRPWGGWMDLLWVKDEDPSPTDGNLDVVQEMCSEISDVVYCLSGDITMWKA